MQARPSKCVTTSRRAGCRPVWRAVRGEECMVRFPRQVPRGALERAPRIQTGGSKEMPTSKAYAAPSARSPLAPFEAPLREVGPHDVLIDIAFCGVCHSDVHQVRDEWGGAIFPMVPGHEIVGRVAKVGGAVTRFREGDLAGVGCMVDSCRTCASCRRGLEQFCEKGAAMTYNGTVMDRKTPHLRRLLERRRGGRGVHAPDRPGHRPRRGGAAALRRHHHLLAAPPLEGGQGAAGRRRRAGRARAHGREARGGHGRRGDHAQHLAREGGRRARGSARTSSRSPRSRPPSRSWRATSTSSSTPSPRRTTSNAYLRHAAAPTARWCWSARRPRRRRSRRSR